MPEISRFFGIVVYMYYADIKKHKLPHIHAIYQGEEGVFTIPDGELIAGNLPKKKKRMIQVWIEIHEEELMANWEKAVNSIEPEKIKPLS